MKSFKDNKTLVMLLALGLFAGLGGGIFENLKFSGGGNPITAAGILSLGENIEPEEPSVFLGFVGNLDLSHEAEKSIIKNGGDYAPLFADAEFLQTPDFMFASLSGPITKNSKGSFVMNPSMLPDLKDAGFDIVSLSDTHLFDAGREGFENTLTNVTGAGLLTCGAGMNHTEAATPTIVSKNGLSVGYLCFTDVVDETALATNEQSGMLGADDPAFDDIIRGAASKVNTLVVVFSFGSTKDSQFTERQEKLARQAVDNGAGMVVGTHPYAPEENITYNNAPIIYSLGNFISPGSNTSKLTDGLFTTAVVEQKGISDVSLYPLSMDKDFNISLK